MLRRVAGHLVTSPPTPSTPPPHPTGAAPASATSALLAAVAGAAVALSAVTLLDIVQDSDSVTWTVTVSEGHKDPNVVKTIEELRELLRVSDAAYGANVLAGAWPGPLALNIIGHVSEPSHFSWTVHADPIAHC